MEIRASIQTVDGQGLKFLFYAGVTWVSHHIETINKMNVFPVPDGDTGINMYHTLKRAYQEIELLENDDISDIASKFAYGALMGARGNSGTILSQILKGFADGLGDYAVLTSQNLLTACENAVKLAYESVREPVEGTILTVAREAHETLSNAYEDNMTLDEMLDVLVSGAEKSLNNTPNLLPILKEAGVVDSGGMGLFYFLQGMIRFPDDNLSSNGHISDNGVQKDSPTWETALIPDDEDGYGYDVQFLMLGENFDVSRVRSDFEDMGWSVLVVGDESTLKVHIHVHNPADPFNYAMGLGAELDDIVVENMQRQYQDYVNHRQQSEPKSYKLPEHNISIISVVSGVGLKAVFHDLNCTHVIAGGQTMNPSTEDFLNIISELPTDKVIILPNNSNIILTAGQVAKIVTDKDIRIIPTKTMLQGITAMIEYGGELSEDITLDDMTTRMNNALEYVTSIEITRAIRSTKFEGNAITEGHYLGIVDGKIRTSTETLEEVVQTIFDEFADEDYELATLYYGDDVTADDANHLIERLSNGIKSIEFEAVYGGQPLYPYLISVE